MARKAKREEREISFKICCHIFYQPTTKSAKGKELVAASESGVKKGKEKEVVVEEVEKKKKKSHKKKPAASG